MLEVILVSREFPTTLMMQFLAEGALQRAHLTNRFPIRTVVRMSKHGVNTVHVYAQTHTGQTQTGQTSFGASLWTGFMGSEQRVVPLRVRARVCVCVYTRFGPLYICALLTPANTQAYLSGFQLGY